MSEYAFTEKDLLLPALAVILIGLYSFSPKKTENVKSGLTTIVEQATNACILPTNAVGIDFERQKKTQEALRYAEDLNRRQSQTSRVEFPIIYPPSGIAR